MRTLQPIALLCFAALLTGCQPQEYYFEAYSVSKRIPAKKSIGILAFPAAWPALPSREGHTMETLAMNFLMQHGSNPVLNLDALEPAAAVAPADKYFTGAARFVSQKPDGQETAEKVTGLNECDEATMRLLSSLKLLKTYSEEWKMDYVLLLWNPASFSYRARVIELASREIIADFKSVGTSKSWFQNNSFTVFESRKVAPKGMRYQSLSVGEKAAIVFLYRVLDAAVGGGIGGGAGGESEEGKDW